MKEMMVLSNEKGLVLTFDWRGSCCGPGRKLKAGFERTRIRIHMKYDATCGERIV
jgi:hypothetical protein